MSQLPRGLPPVAAGILAMIVAVSVPSSLEAATLPQPVIGDDVPATATDLRVPSSQNSPMVLADPTESRFVVLAHRQDAPTFSCGLQVSGDRGRSWVAAHPVPTLPEGADTCYAPEVVFDRRGRLYYLFIALAGEGNNPVGVYLTTSDDRARTFTPPRQLLGPSHYQVRMAIDPTSGEHGRIHLVWLRAATDSLLGGLSPDPNPLFSAYSDDRGRTFSEPVQVNDANRPRSVAPAIVVGADHAVHIAYFDLQDDVRDYGGLEGPAWDGFWSVVVTSSYDGGRTFGRGVAVDERLVPPGRVMLIYTMAPPALAADDDGNVYVGWSDSRQGDPDVFLARSNDRGGRWEPLQRVNDDPMGSGRDQYLPRLGVAPSGRVDVVFLDRRNDPNNLRNDVYYAYSTDGGRTLSANLKVSSDSSDSRVGQRYLVPSAEGLVEIGGRLGLLPLDGSLIAAWPDMRNGSVGSPEQNVFTAVIEFPGVSEGDGGGGFPWLPVGIAGVAAILVVAVILVRRSADHASTPSAS